MFGPSVAAYIQYCIKNVSPTLLRNPGNGPAVDKTDWKLTPTAVMPVSTRHQINCWAVRKQGIYMHQIAKK